MKIGDETNRLFDDEEEIIIRGERAGLRLEGLSFLITQFDPIELDEIPAITRPELRRTSVGSIPPTGPQPLSYELNIFRSPCRVIVLADLKR